MWCEDKTNLGVFANFLTWVLKQASFWSYFQLLHTKTHWRIGCLKSILHVAFMLQHITYFLGTFIFHKVRTTAVWKELKRSCNACKELNTFTRLKVWKTNNTWKHKVLYLPNRFNFWSARQRSVSYTELTDPKTGEDLFLVLCLLTTAYLKCRLLFSIHFAHFGDLHSKYPTSAWCRDTDTQWYSTSLVLTLMSLGSWQYKVSSVKFINFIPNYK